MKTLLTAVSLAVLSTSATAGDYLSRQYARAETLEANKAWEMTPRTPTQTERELAAIEIEALDRPQTKLELAVVKFRRSQEK